MQFTFTRELLYQNKACYSREKALELQLAKKEYISLKDLIVELPIEDFIYIFLRLGDLTQHEKLNLGFYCINTVYQDKRLECGQRFKLDNALKFIEGALKDSQPKSSWEDHFKKLHSIDFSNVQAKEQRIIMGVKFYLNTYSFYDHIELNSGIFNACINIAFKASEKEENNLKKIVWEWIQNNKKQKPA